MKLEHIFKTPTIAKVLDLLLANPNLHYLQSDLRCRLNIDKATMRRSIARLHALGLIDLDVDPGGVHLKSVRFNTESGVGRAFLTLHDSLSRIQA
jgi:DNA-binding MarR family transcriptional regulator